MAIVIADIEFGHFFPFGGLEESRFQPMVLGDRESCGNSRIVLPQCQESARPPGMFPPDIIVHRCQANVLQQCQWNIESNSIAVQVVCGLVAESVYIPLLP